MVTRRELRAQREAAERRQQALADASRAPQLPEQASPDSSPATEQGGSELTPQEHQFIATESPSQTGVETEPDEPEEHSAQHDETDEPGHRRRPWLFATIAIIVIIGLAVTGLYLFRGVIGDLFNPAAEDYTGSGSGTVNVQVVTGDNGSSIATKLKNADVIATRKAFLEAIAKQKTEPVFQPGSFTLKRKMSAARALAVLTDSANRNVMKVVVPEGFTVKRVVQRMVAAGFKQSELEAALENPTALGVPADAHDAEGYLFPATYSFNEGIDAVSALKQMVQGTEIALVSAGVNQKDWNRTIILASIVQKEAKRSDDFPKVARVLDNRLKKGMNLQLDSTVSYGAGSTTVTTTAKQRADKSNKYNTYAHSGLPVGAISNPGADAIDAVMQPAKGDWLYFVAVNLSTGKTVFSETAAEHAKAVAQFQAWIQKNPHWNEAAQ